jgi:flavodoxin
MENDTCIIITGLILEEYIGHILTTYKDIQNKMIVTWKDQDQDLLKILEDYGFHIVLNDYPQKRCSTNYQTRNIYTGLSIAKEMLFKYAIRMRTDVKCNDFLKFMDIIRHLYVEKISCICGQGYTSGYYNDELCEHITWDTDYFQDFCIAGEIDNMIPMFIKEQEEDDDRFPEVFWLENYLNKRFVNKDEIKTTFNYFIGLMEDNQITFYWRKTDSANIDLLNHLNETYRIIY